MTPIPKRTRRALALILPATLGALALASAQPLAHAAAPSAPVANPTAPAALHFDFNTPGATIANRGSILNAALSQRTADNKSGDFIGPDASGLTGKPGDRALDHGSATGMGLTHTGPCARTEARGDTMPALNNMASFTIAGWFNASETPDNGVELLNFADGKGGWKITFVNKGALRLFVNAGNVACQQKAWAAAGSWQFFAITYDASANAPAQNVAFYSGSVTGPVRLVATAALAEGGVKPSAARLMLGNPTRPFRGRLDNLRMFTAHHGPAAALDLAALENLRAADLASAPPAAAVTRTAPSAPASDANASPLNLPHPPAWLADAEKNPDARRDSARTLFLRLLERAIATNAANQEAQLDKNESAQKALSRFTLFVFYAQAYRASLIPADARGHAGALRARYVKNSRRALLAFATATRTDRKAQADQNEFSQATCVALYEELLALGALGEKDKAAALAALGDGAQAVLELKAERGAFNRAAYVAVGLAETARILPDDPRAAAWKKFATAVWEIDWLREKDTIEDCRGYNGLWIYATFRLGEALGRAADLRDPAVEKTFSRYTHMVAPNGAMPDLGNSYWWHGLEHWVCAAEMIGAFYKRADFLDNSLRLARFIDSQPDLDLGEMEAFVDLCKLTAPAAPPLPPRPRAAVTTRTTEYGDNLFDKLYLRTGDTPASAYICVDLHDGGYHGHSDGGTIALYTKGPHVLLHTLGRLETFANQHQGVWSAKTARELVADSTAQYRADEWNRWLLNFRWPGTHMGGLSIDPAKVKQFFFRLSDPEKFTGEGTLEVRNLTGVRRDGSTAIISPGWTGKQNFSATKSNERAFLGPREKPAITDWSEFTHLLVDWKSNVPVAVEWFGIDAAAFNDTPDKTGSLRVRNSSRTLSAHTNPDASIASGGFKREFFDASGRRIFHWRDLRLRANDGSLVVLDTFEFAEDGDYAIGPVWHAQHIVRRDKTSIVVRDDAQYEDDKHLVAQPPCELRFDFAASAPLAIVTSTYESKHPQKEHFAAACEGPRKAGERLTIVSVLRPALAEEIQLRMKIGGVRISAPGESFTMEHPDFP